MVDEIERARQAGYDDGYLDGQAVVLEMLTSGLPLDLAAHQLAEQREGGSGPDRLDL